MKEEMRRLCRTV